MSSLTPCTPLYSYKIQIPRQMIRNIIRDNYHLLFSSILELSHLPLPLVFILYPYMYCPVEQKVNLKLCTIFCRCPDNRFIPYSAEDSAGLISIMAKIILSVSKLHVILSEPPIEHKLNPYPHETILIQNPNPKYVLSMYKLRQG